MARSTDKLKPSEYFIYIVKEKTDVNQNLESRYVQAAKIWKIENNCGIPYANFTAFKDAYYRSFKKKVRKTN